MADNPGALALRTLVIGCTPLARKVVELLGAMSQLVGVINLHPELIAGKSNYDGLAGFTERRRDDIFWTRDVNDAPTTTWIRGRAPDVLVQCGWSQIFRPEVLSIPRLLAVGIHPSPLPMGRGAAVINWRIIEGGGPWGNSLFVMEPKTDTGDVLDFEPFEIEARDDVRTAYLKVDRTALKMLRRTLPRIADGTVPRLRQDPTRVSRYLRRTPRDGRMETSWTSRRICDFVRGLTSPFPGAYFDTLQGPLIVWRAEAGPGISQAAAGSVLDVIEGRGIRLACGEGGSVWITFITPPGDSECWADEWAREQELVPGMSLFSAQP